MGGFVSTCPGLEDGAIADNILLIGDAARIIDPITGGGICHACRTGMYAGKVLTECAKTGDYSKKALQPYEKMWRDRMEDKLYRNWWAKERLATLDDETINGIRAGLMGPLAGLGDSIIVGTFIPILLGIALGLSTGGSVLGPLFYIVAWNVAMYFGMKYAYNQGYTMGGAAVEALVGPQSAALRSSIVMVGTMVIGAVAATWINITTALQVTFTKDSAFVLQDTLDGIFPKALNFFFVWLCWWLMTKKKISPTVVMLILVGIAFVGVLVGFFDPKLKY